MTHGNESDRLTVSVDEAAKLLGISRNTAYAAVKKGELKAIHIGRRCLVPRCTLDELLTKGAAARRGA